MNLLQKIAFLSFFTGNVALGAELNDVQILEYVPNKDSVRLKIHAKEQPKDGYFFLEIVKSDPQAFEKTLQVLKKVRWGAKYNLRLNIPSFSPSPSGSSYRSDAVTFGEAGGATSEDSPDGLAKTGELGNGSVSYGRITKVLNETGRKTKTGKGKWYAYTVFKILKRKQ